jgi:hypothetical protein
MLAPVFFDESLATAQQVKATPAAEPVAKIPAEGDRAPNCAICHEQIQKYYDEEEETWMLKVTATRKKRNMKFVSLTMDNNTNPCRRL